MVVMIGMDMGYFEERMRRARAWWAKDRRSPGPLGPSIYHLMLAEQSHRIANDMMFVASSLHLLPRRSPAEAEQMLQNAVARVGMVGEMQRLLIPPLDSTTRELRQSLEALCERIGLTHLAPKNVLLDLAIDHCEMKAQTCWAVCAIVAELVTNAAKHAFPETGGTVAVTGRRIGRALVVSVSDDGTGTSIRPSQEGGVRGKGSAIVEQLVGAFGGRIHHPATSTGTTVELWVNLER